MASSTGRDTVDNSTSAELKTHLQRALHVVPLSTTAWALGWTTVGAFTATMAAAGPPGARHAYTLCDVAPVMILIALFGFFFARRDCVQYAPAHILMGSPIGPWLLMLIFGPFLLRSSGWNPISEWGAFEKATLLLWYLVTPAAAAVGMIRGVRARNGNYLLSLLWCAALLASCCYLAWRLSYTPIGHVFTDPSPALTRCHHVPPQTQDLGIHPAERNEG